MASSLIAHDRQIARPFEILCHKHPASALTHGCIEYDCEKCAMCA